MGDLLEELQPSSNLLNLALAMFRRAWDTRLDQVKAMARDAKDEVRKLDRQIESLLDRIVDATSPSVVSVYEGRIAKLERQRLLIEEQAAKTGKPRGTFEEVFELTARFLSSPYKIWENGDFHHRKLVLKLAFAKDIPYCRNEGFRTPKMTLPFKALASISGGKKAMAETKSESLFLPDG